MRILVLAREAIDAARVRSALPGDDLDGAEVLVVATAEQQSKLKFWMGDNDEAIADAGERADEVAGELRAEGAQARAETGESNPVLAVRDALATFPADRILVFGDEELAQEVRSNVDVEVTAAR